MGKKTDGNKDAKAKAQKAQAENVKRGKAKEGGKATEASKELSRKDYAREMKKLHIELVKLQQWVVHAGLKVCIVFEGRDGAGKGGVIKAITERVSPEERTRRLEGRIDDGRKLWKLTGMDPKSYSRWYDYSRARDDMFKATDTGFAPWYVARTDDKERGRLNLISHLLNVIPYKELPREKIKLPKRQKPGDYRDPEYSYKYVKEKF